MGNAGASSGELRLRVDQTVMHRKERKLEPLRHSGPIEYVRQMVLDRVFADQKFTRDVRIRVGLRNQRNNLQLPWRQGAAGGLSRGAVPS